MTEVIAQTSLGNSIELRKLGDPQKPILLLVGGVHGDEPEGVWFVEQFLKCPKDEWSNWNCQIWAIPNLNPDGFKSRHRVNGRGVDLNRNFPTFDWTPEAKAPRYFPGEKPGSEIETQTLMSVIDRANPYLLVHCHSWIPQIVYTGDTAKGWANTLAQRTGYPLKEDIGYPTPGSIGQYGWFHKKVPVICIEFQEGSKPEDVFRIGLDPLFAIAREGQGR